ncbi:LLM class flavin-dependent oxidoreductase [Psittacicella gerlachiana]|uniref:Luciferase-like domain-containing protein n=1 Tax=Psittacicella gerlachiana TaxID=2028574 RepID=A0A3A1YE24_9GAMM|nr:LLM class flavin-dependent oxidoreductase [Psittacicella gerlachiana]RIY36422.1 hypothetical protein CKF59_02815 [Psittacicella gerlachiana]
MTQAKLPLELQNHQAFTRVFAPHKLTLGLIAPFNGYPTPFPDLSNQKQLLEMIDNSPIAAIWVRDVPFYDPRFGDVGQGTDPFVTLGYYAAVTKNVTLGSAGIIATLRNPIDIAKAVASVDLISQQRFLLGLATGDRPGEYAPYGYKFNNRAERYRETWELVHKLYTTDFPEFTTENYGNFRGDLDFYPKPKQAIPMLTIGRSRQDLTWIAQNASAWINHGLIHNPENLAHMVHELASYAPNKWTPLGIGLFLNLDPNDNTPLDLGPFYVTAGSKALVALFKQLEELGVNHVSLNLKPSYHESQEATLKRFIDTVAVHFPHH